MASPNFQSILSQSPTEVIRPKPLPKGTYLCTVGQWESGESSKKKTPFVKFPLKPLAPLDDVDSTELTEVGGLENKTLSVTYYITEDAIGMLDEFHTHCGIDLTDGATRIDRNDEVTNSQVLAVVDHEIDQNDPSRVYTRVRRTAMSE